MRDNFQLACAHPSASGGYCLVFLVLVSPPFALSVLGHGAASWLFWLLWVAGLALAAHLQFALSAQWVFDVVAKEAQLLLTSASGTTQEKIVPFADFLQVVVQGSYMNHNPKNGPNLSYWNYKIVCLYRDGEGVGTLEGSQSWGQSDYSLVLGEAQQLGRLLEVPVSGQISQVYRLAEDKQGFLLDEAVTSEAYPAHEGSQFSHDFGNYVSTAGCLLFFTYVAFLGFNGCVKTVHDLSESSRTTRMLEKRRRQSPPQVRPSPRPAKQVN